MKMQELEPFLEKIIKIKRLATVPTNSKTSYFGGHPYIPANGVNFDWPVNADGNKLVFVTQINFSEVPQGYGYPEKGLLQVFVNLEDYEPSKNGENGLKVIYYSEQDLAYDSLSSPIDKLEVEFDGMAGPFWEGNEPNMIEFIEGKQIDPELLWVADDYLGNESYYCESMSGQIDKVEALVKIIENDRDGFNLLREDLSDFGDQLGGSPRWIQGAIEEFDFKADFMLQLGSEDMDYMMFGDLGNMHVFGNLQKLNEGDVSEFMWEWACH